MRRVLLTGASTPLGRELACRLSATGADVVGVDVDQGVVRSDHRARSLLELLAARPVDGVIHAGMCPSRSGSGTGAADVVSTQQLAAAISGRGPVRVVVAVSSTEAYAVRSSTPTWRREDEDLERPPGSAAASVLEAEDYLRELAERQPHVSVAILRLADLVGPACTSPMSALWRRRWVPFVAGYDPPVQVVHIDDACAAVEHAAAHELAGTFNVAGPGVVTWTTAARLTGGQAVPAPLLPAALGGAFAGLGVPRVPGALVDVARFGRCVDTAALAAAGFTPQHTTAACLRAIGERA